MRPICVTSGWLVVVALAALHYPVTHGVLSTGHGYDTKSIAQAYLECLQYLNISRQSMYAYDTDAAAPSNTNCLMRCIGLNTRWWDDSTGLNEPALVRFFRHVDDGALGQARTCLADQPALDQSDSCAAAYGAFRCYGDALGEVVAHAEYLVPRRDTIRQAVHDCAGMLQVSDEQLATCVATESFLRVPDGTRLLRCIVTRLGWYADATGVASDRLRLLMDDGTAGLWTEERANDAKRCEQDLRELGADVCQVAAQSVEICYGRQAFDALWQVLQEQYGARVEMFDTERVEQVQAANAVEDGAESYPVPKTRYRSLLIIAPDVYTVDASSEENLDSSSQETKPVLGKLTVQEVVASGPDAPLPATTMTEETVKDDTEQVHVVRARSALYPMAPELPAMYTPGNLQPMLSPYPARFRRSVPLPHYHPGMMPLMHPHYCRPLVKRSIPLEPMYVPLYHGVVPQRFVREVAPAASTQDRDDSVQDHAESAKDAPMVPEDLESMAEDDTAEATEPVREVHEQPDVEQKNDVPSADASSGEPSTDAENLEDLAEYIGQPAEQTNPEVATNNDVPNTDLNTDASAGEPGTDPAESNVVNVEDLTEYIGQPPEQTLNAVNTEPVPVGPAHPAAAARPVNPASGPNLMKAIQLAHILSRMKMPPAAANQEKV